MRTNIMSMTTATERADAARRSTEAVCPLTGETYRFAVDKDGGITRARIYQLPTEWTHDSWSHYWDDSEHVAFFDGYNRDGIYAPKWAESDETDRAMRAYRAEKAGEKGSEGALDRLAVRLTGNPDSRFITVGIDRGCDFFVLSWSGDPDREWADEIECLNNGDIWRMEIESFDGERWQADDEYPDEWYGEDKARAQWEKVFDLAQFPAEHVLTEAGA